MAARRSPAVELVAQGVVVAAALALALFDLAVALLAIPFGLLEDETEETNLDLKLDILAIGALAVAACLLAGLALRAATQRRPASAARRLAAAVALTLAWVLLAS